MDRWKETELKNIFDDYPGKNVFNFDEAGVFWRLLPKRTFCLPGESCHDSQKSKERVTVMVCANSDGSKKRPLLIIGKFARPRCFKNLAKHPEEYANSKNAWMTSPIFEKWLNKWNSELFREN